MREVGLYHLLCIAVENPINRSLGRHRLYPLLCERLLDGSGPTVFAMLGQRLAQGHDNLGDALGRFGRGGSGASAQFCAPGEIPFGQKIQTHYISQSLRSHHRLLPILHPTYLYPILIPNKGHRL